MTGRGDWRILWMPKTFTIRQTIKKRRLPERECLVKNIGTAGVFFLEVRMLIRHTLTQQGNDSDFKWGSSSQCLMFTSMKDGKIVPHGDRLGYVPNHEEIDFIIGILEEFKKDHDDDEILDFNKFLYEKVTKRSDEMLQTIFAQNKRDIAGWVYVIHGENNRFKIGISKNVEKRLKSFSQLPFPVTLIYKKKTKNMEETELFLHKKYEEQRINGEWFELSDKDIKNIIRYLESEVA